MSTEIPVDVQVFRAYPNVQNLLEQRGFDVSSYPALSYEDISQNHLKTQMFVPPILTQEHEKSRMSFGNASREWKEIHSFMSDSECTASLSESFQVRYSALTQLLQNLYKQPSKKNQEAMIDTLVSVYRAFTQRRIEVHFHQCFNPENLWGANSRDKKFMNEMNTMIASMEEFAYELYNSTWKEKMHTSLPKDIMIEYQDKIIIELVSLFKKSYTLLFLYRTRSKASATLDKKYEVYCSNILKKHGVFIQLFNARHLMFNVTKHEIVPKHEALDVWHDSEEIDRIKRVYNMTNLAKENPVIGLNDPVAKFIGLRKGQLCKITRINPSSGTYVTYRWCK